MATETSPPRLARLDPSGVRRLGHVTALDGVRGLAVLLVTGLHAGLAIRPRNGGLLPGGFIGVDIFFVLSGFLITSLLVSERAATGRVAMSRFYARRGLRLLPALLVLLAAHVLYALWTDISLRLEAKSILAIVFYVSNWAQADGPRVPGGIVHTWTLSIEEQFYLIWPFALLLLVRYVPSRNAMLAIVAGGALASAAVRVWIWVYGSGYPAAYMRTDARADGLLIGVGLALMWRWQLFPRRGLSAAASVCLVGLLGVAVFWDSSSPGMFYGGYTVVSLAAAVVILAVVEGSWRWKSVFETKQMVAVGRVSYGLYLWQGLCLHAAAAQLDDQPRVVVAAAGVALAAAATYLSWRYVEQPFLRIKDRRVASRVTGQ